MEKRHPEWNFVYIKGSMVAPYFYENIDVYLRPTRHDGLPRIIKECELLNIPVIWSYETGKYREPDVNEIEERLKIIKDKL